ncbi:MAG: hypothetical protein FWC41_02945 [Firmicutes bacterium]|nr:hypothetical protein [Bacillota bacterium]
MEEQLNKTTFKEKLVDFFFSKKNMWIVGVFVLLMIHNCSQNKHIQNLQVDSEKQQAKINEVIQVFERLEKITEIRLLENHIEFITEIKEIVDKRNNIELLQELSINKEKEIQRLKEENKKLQEKQD